MEEGGDAPGLEQRFAFGPPASEKIAAVAGLLNVFEWSLRPLKQPCFLLVHKYFVGELNFLCWR